MSENRLDNIRFDNNWLLSKDEKKYSLYDPNNTLRASGNKEIIKEISERINREDFLMPGDLLGIKRKGLLYTHFSIYAGNNQVIHYADKDSDFHGYVHLAPISEFLQNDKDVFFLFFSKSLKDVVKIYVPNDKGNYLIGKPYGKCPKFFYDREETLERARSKDGEEKYDIISNNCEHFAYWCKTGISSSAQVKKVEKVAANAILSLCLAAVILKNKDKD